MTNYSAEVYERPEVRQALAKLFVDLNDQLPKRDQWEIPEDIQELSNKERRTLSKKVGRRGQAV